MNGLSKLMILLGILLVVAGIIMNISGKIPFFGKLPGDIYIKKGNFSFFFPITSCIIISIVISVILKLFGK